MSKQKQWCSGAGQFMPVNEPTSLVDCPVCARKNLGATHTGRWGDNDYTKLGCVPPHRARPLRPEQIPNQHFVSPTAERDARILRAYINGQDDADVRPQDGFLGRGGR